MELLIDENVFHIQVDEIIQRHGIEIGLITQKLGQLLNTLTEVSIECAVYENGRYLPA
jgi:hypothetical protein